MNLTITSIRYLLAAGLLLIMGCASNSTPLPRDPRTFESDLAKEAENSIFEMQKTLSEIEQRTSDAIDAENEKLETLQREMPLSTDSSEQNVSSATSKSWIQTQATHVQRMADRSEAFLGLDQVRRQLAPESETFLKEQLASGRDMMTFAVESSNSGLSQHSYSIVKSVYDFTFRLASGDNSGFYDLEQTIEVVWK